MPSDRTRLVFLHAVFLVSGFTAVIYQLIWQRVLLTLYGANTETVTVVVTAFMLGLGAGSLAGGEVSRSGRSLPAMFAALELGVGVCGLGSLQVFAAVNEWTVTASPVAGGFVVFLLLLVPTALMGATLPILIAYTARRAESVGRAVGSLYAINALGSAIGAGAAIVVVFGALGQQRSIFLAASLNGLVALAAAGLARSPAATRVAA
jgi:predicted membrane-bound spermidine synthase